jgi:hypothetical protein
MEDDLNFFENGRQPQFCLKMEDYLFLFENARQPQNKKKQHLLTGKLITQQRTVNWHNLNKTGFYTF